MKQLIDQNTGGIAWLGSAFGWLSFDLLRASQIFAALMAGLVSVVALIISLPKAVAIVKKGWKASIESSMKDKEGE